MKKKGRLLLFAIVIILILSLIPACVVSAGEGEGVRVMEVAGGVTS